MFFFLVSVDNDIVRVDEYLVSEDFKEDA